MAKIDSIAKDVALLKERLVEKVPGDFGAEHIIIAFFGALLFGFTFVLKGQLFNVGLALDAEHLLAITAATWLILSAEIYFVGYRRVRDQYKRKFGQFWAKRIVTYYTIAILTSGLLLWLYQITSLAATPYNALKLVIAVSFPAAIGAAMTDLIGKY